MAKQRQTDVNINYHVNTVEVDRANELLKKASQSTDQIRAATNNFGQQAGKTFQTTSKYIEGMEIELARLRQQIKLTNTQDTARLKQLSDQYKALKSQVDSYNKSLFETEKASKQTAQATQSMARQFGDVYTAVKLFITAGVAREIVNISLEMAKLSGNVEGVTRAFEKQIPGAQSVLMRLRETTQGTVNDLELMQRALQAQNFGIDVQRLPELLEFAAVRAQQTGQSVDYLVNSIVTGIGRKSLLILDNLGISATRLKAEFNGAALASKTVGEVTNGVADIAKAEMEKMGGYVTTAATEVDQLTTSWHELRVEISKLMTDGPGGGLVAFLKEYVDSFKVLVEAYNRGVSVSEVFAEKQRDIVAEMSVNEFINRRFTKDKVENIKILEEEIRVLTKSIGSWAAFRDEQQKMIDVDQKEIDRLKQSYQPKQDELIQLAQNIKFRRDLINAKKEDTLIDQAILRLLQSRLMAMKAINKEEKPTGDGKRAMPAELKQVIDFDLKNPVTGEVGKYDRDNLIKVVTDMIALNAQVFSAVVDGAREKFTIQVSPSIVKMDEWDHIANEFAARWKEVVSAGIFDTTTLINATIQAEANSYDVRLSKLRAFYDEQILLAGDNERAKKELAIKREREEQRLRKKAFEADKEAKRLTTVINGAAGVINAFATLPYPAAIVASLLIAAETATQLAVINKQQFTGYAKGVIDLKGPGTKTSDSINARLSKGESVMTADETASSKGILKSIRAKRLNDKMLKDIVSGRSGGAVAPAFDDSRIVDHLKDLKNSTPDVKRVGNIMYETRVKTDTYRMWVRSRSMP